MASKDPAKQKTAKQKPASMTESLSQQARSLLTAAERKLLETSFGAALAKASREAAQSTLVRIRSMRDKWHDLHAKQARATKRSTRSAAGPAIPAPAANQRSREKVDLFDAAVRRLEARLSELMAGATTAPRGKAATKPAPGRRRKAGAARAAKAAAGNGATKPAITTATKEDHAKRAGAGRSKKARSPDTLATLAASSAGQSIRFDRSRQRSAKTAARVARGRIEGASTRNSHMVALGKRAQVRRDLRNKK